ncbi:sugar ABC transporter permease [Cellulomonas citrea]|uniref:sugar ABC transporter permease n=1 Tax=Cellulomonas citrea TaxID=1909423 RepID=UPI00135BA5C0|nr:sugar ABC transporter permease [Cellulomonas citrea]
MSTQTATAQVAAPVWRRLPLPRDTGSLTVVVGLVLVWVVFQTLNANFLSARNLSNLVLQIAVLGTLAIGMVIVLVLGEIDLSVGAIAGVSAAVMALAVSDHGWNAAAGIALALVVGAAIGLAHGAIITAFGIPSFIVTLAGLLVWQGVQLALVGDGGEIPIRDPFIRGIASTYVPVATGWVIVCAALVAMALVRLAVRRRRTRLGLAVPPLASELVTALVTVVLVVGVVAVLDSYFGIPWVLVFLVTLMTVCTLVMRETRLGRHLYAIGGNAEAARRSGIRVRGATVAVFVIVSAIAAAAGIIEASRQFSASNALGGGTLQLNAIAAAVIGGTSLFGGRGRVYHALLGALVVGSVQNGLDLLGQPAAIKNVATGVILIIAVIVDALGRRRRLARGSTD